MSPDQEADYYIVNSCTVTATADQKTRQSVRRFKRRHPGATVILTGCMPQAFPEEAKAQLDADIVFSNKSDGDIFSIINRYHTEKSRIVDINAHQTGDPFAPCAISGFGQRVRAFVKIEDGCDRFCSYCIIPKSRGRVRSKAPADLEKEVQDLAAHGIKEIVLVGINLSAYGKGQDFDLLDAVAICDRHPRHCPGAPGLSGAGPHHRPHDCRAGKDRKILSPVPHLSAKRLHQNLKIHEPPLHGG